MEEKLGAFLLSLTFLSFAISLIPLSHVRYGSPEGRVIRLDGCEEIYVSLGFGSVEVLRTNGSDPYAVIRGLQVSESSKGKINGLLGRLSIYIPEGWGGSLKISLRYGSITLNGVHLREILILMHLGAVEGDLTALGRVRVELRAGSVYLALSVPSDSEPRVILHCTRSLLRYDGRVLLGDYIESLLWRGSYPLSIEIEASSAELSVFRFKG